MVPRFEVTQQMNFNYVYNPPAPIGFNDLMCCPTCTA